MLLDWHQAGVDIDRQLPLLSTYLGHAYLSTTGTYLEGISSEEIIGAVHGRKAPMMHASTGLEDYTAEFRGEPIAAAVLVTLNGAGQAQHVAANYRPRSSLLHLSRLVGEKLAGTP